MNSTELYINNSSNLLVHFDMSHFEKGLSTIFDDNWVPRLTFQIWRLLITDIDWRNFDGYRDSFPDIADIKMAF